MHHNFNKSNLANLPGMPVIFLPGWGFDGRIVNLIRPLPAWIYPLTFIDPATVLADLHDLVRSAKAEKIELVGWSMGAMPALDFARKYPDLLQRLTLVSTRRRWPAAEIARLHSELAADPSGFLAGFYRKCFLGHREAAHEFSERLAADYMNMSPEKIDLLHRGLDYLGTADTSPVAGIDTRIIHGARDIIAPLDQMTEFPGAAIEILNRAGHLPFISPECSLLKTKRQDIIRSRFSRAAASYDEHALVQKYIAGLLMAELLADERAGSSGKILEIGCGTGNYTTILAEHFSGAAIKAIDFSKEMLELAGGKLKSFNNVELICADGEEYLARAGRDEFDLITSNGALQWFSGLDRALLDIDRLLRPGGKLLFSIFGPRSLEELNRGIKDTFNSRAEVAATDFPDQQRLHEALAAFFPGADIREELTERQYKDIYDLLRHIRKTGTSGWQQGNPLIFTRSSLKRLDQWFIDKLGGCKVTYQNFIVKCVK